MEESPAIEFVVRYGYLTLFLIVMVENIEFFGSFPTSVIAAAMGAVASEGYFDPTISIIILTTSSVLGDVVGYFLGRKFGRPLLLRWGRKVLEKNNRLERTETMVKKYGTATVFFSRFIMASLQAIINIIAGITRMRFSTFFIAALLGEFVWTLIYFYLGFYAWGSIEGFFKYVTSAGVFGGILTIGVVGIVVAAVYYLRKRFYEKF